MITPLRPDPGPPEPPATGAVERGHPVLDWITANLDAVPGWAWAAAATALLLASVITLPITRALAYRAGRRAAGHTKPTDRRDRALLIAAITPAVLLWITVLIGSARGLVGFGRDTLRWRDGWEYLVPGTLDGVGISFGLLAFLAVRNGRNPDRSVRLAAGAMLAGATINFVHEAGLAYGSWLGGAYLALMSVFGLLIFDELLSQFEDGAGEIRRSNPKFGMRWITWPTNTACAWVAWRNYPPAEGTRATVVAAVAHLDSVRATKRQRRAGRPSGRLRTAWAILRGHPGIPVAAHPGTAPGAPAGIRVDTAPAAHPGARAGSASDTTAGLVSDTHPGVGQGAPSDTHPGTGGANESGAQVGIDRDAEAGVAPVRKPGNRPAKMPTRTRARKPTSAQLKAQKLKAQNPDITWAQLAAKCGVNERTARRWFESADDRDDDAKEPSAVPGVLPAFTPLPARPDTRVNGHDFAASAAGQVTQ